MEDEIELDFRPQGGVEGKIKHSLTIQCDDWFKNLSTILPLLNLN